MDLMVHRSNNNKSLRETILIKKIYFISDTNNKRKEEHTTIDEGFGTIFNVYTYNADKYILETIKTILPDCESIHIHNRAVNSIDGDVLYIDKMWYIVQHGQQKKEVLDAITSMSPLSKQKCQIRRSVWKEYQKEKKLNITP